MKRAVREPESSALRRYLRRKRPLVSSALARAEEQRALLPAGEKAAARGRSVLRRLDLIRVNDQVLNAAGVLMPIELRSLDAIHIATAQRVGSDLKALVSYDDRMVGTATELGHQVLSPR